MLQVTEEYTEKRDPQLNSLQKYAELAAQYDLIETPVKVERDEDAPALVTICAKFGRQDFTFDSISDAVHWLAFIFHVADYTVSENC